MLASHFAQSGSSVLALIALRTRPTGLLSLRRGSLLRVPARILPSHRVQLLASTLGRKSYFTTAIAASDAKTEPPLSQAEESEPSQAVTPLNGRPAGGFPPPPPDASTNSATSSIRPWDDFFASSLPEKLAFFAERKTRLEAKLLIKTKIAVNSLNRIAQQIWNEDPTWVPPLIVIDQTSGRRIKIELRLREKPVVTTLVESWPRPKKDKTPAESISSKSPSLSPKTASTTVVVPRAISADVPLSSRTTSTSRSTFFTGCRAVPQYPPNPLVKGGNHLVPEAEIKVAFAPLLSAGWKIDIEPFSGRDDAGVMVLARTLDIKDLHPSRSQTDLASEKDDFWQRSTRLAIILFEMFELHKHHADISFDDSKFSIKVTTHQTRPAFTADHTSSHSPRATPKSPKTSSPHGLTGRDLVLGLSMQSAILDIGAMTSEELAETKLKP